MATFLDPGTPKLRDKPLLARTLLANPAEHRNAAKAPHIRSFLETRSSPTSKDVRNTALKNVRQQTRRDYESVQALRML
jgi:hypothetical protein